MLIALGKEGRVEASTAERGTAYVCPGCRDTVILKRGQIKVAHFAHKPPITCAWAGGETQGHLRAKAALRDGFRATGHRAEVEVEVISVEGDRRADVLVWGQLSGRTAAIEVQHQPLSFEGISRRTKAYIAARVPVAWISLLSSKAMAEAEVESGHLVIRRYSVRPWERWAHTYGKGELWFFNIDTGQLWRGELKPHQIEVAYSSWYDSYGDEQSAGGYMRMSRKWRELHLHGPYEPSQIRLELFNRAAWSGKNYDVPAGQAARLAPLAAQARGTATG